MTRPPTARSGELLWARLTPTERLVADLALGGSSNVAIAELRGTSVRTVANQLASVFRKVRVCSRVELAARLGDDSGLG